MNFLFIFFIGASIGSFCSLVIQRTNRNESFISPRSHCDKCLIILKPFELIPIISFLILRGRCRYCKARIPNELLIHELMFGGLFILQLCFMFPLLIFISLLILMLLSIIDFQKLMVPTYLVLLLLLNNAIYYFHFNSGNWIYFILIIGGYLSVQLINYFTLKIGNGDIDIIFILMLILGLQQIPALIIIASILALTYSFIIMKAARIAFIPFLSCSYLICLISM